MNTLFTPLFLVSFLASTVLAQDTYMINTPMDVVECQPTLLTWTGGTSPYYLSILPAGQPNAASLVDLGIQTGMSYTWVVNLTYGTAGFCELRDSTGKMAQSGPFQVGRGSDSNCINPTSAGNTSVTSAGTSTGAATGATTVLTGTASGTTPAALSSATGTTGDVTKTSPSTSSPSTAAAKPKSSTAAAASHYAPVGTLAMIGVAAFALVL